MLKLKKNNQIAIEIDIAEALTTLNKTTGDITEVVFMVKKQPGDADNIAILTKRLTTSGITLSAGKYYVNMVPADYANFIVGKSYYFAVGILYSGLSQNLELDLDNNQIMIETDLIRS